MQTQQAAKVDALLHAAYYREDGGFRIFGFGIREGSMYIQVVDRGDSRRRGSWYYYDFKIADPLGTRHSFVAAGRSGEAVSSSV
jgi:hypothetical protein